MNGAGNNGLMAASANACMEAGGAAIGVIPQFMIDEGWEHNHMTRLEVTATMHERKARMMEISDAAIALPGGPGTLEELAENITWKELRLYCGPTVLVNQDGYYEPLIEMYGRMAGRHFMRTEFMDLVKVVNTPEEAVLMCETTPPWTFTKRSQALY